MSGGHFNYEQHHIENILHDIEDIIESREHLPLVTKAALPEFERYLKATCKALQLASITVRRLDWFISGDDSYETYVEKLKKEITDMESK